MLSCLFSMRHTVRGLRCQKCRVTMGMAVMFSFLPQKVDGGDAGARAPVYQGVS